MGTHTAQISNYFNRTARQQRLLVSEESYARGMNYTENVLTEGSSKILINYMLRDSGNSLSPREGLIDYTESFDTGISASDNNTIDKGAFHYSTYGVYEDKNGTNVYTDMCFSLGRLSNDCYRAEGNMFAMIQDVNTKEWVIAKYEGDTDYRCKSRVVTNTVHDFNQCTMHEPICTMYNGHLYCMIKEGADGKYSLARINIKETANEVEEGEEQTYRLVLSIETLTARDISVPTALSSGYNMLSESPYTFENKESTVLKNRGWMMYKPGTDELFLDARLGDSIDFVCWYDYIAGHNYEVQWEYASNEGNNIEFTVIQDWTSITSTGGEIRFNYTPTDTSFIMKSSIRDKSDANYTSPYAINFTLGQVSDPLTSNYDLMTAQYMSTHAKMLLLWGVTGAENMLFASAVSGPDYFPFPQNTVAFDEKIVAVEPYLQNLVIITTKKVYLLNFPASVTTGNILAQTSVTTLHETLGIQDIDAPTVKAISNMIFFRTNNKFYVIAPVAKAGVYTLKVLEAHVGIQEFTDKFAEKLETIMDKMWQIAPDYIKLVKSYTFVDATKAKVLYLVQLADDLLVNVILSYDTATYVWMMEIHQANYSMVPYKASDIRPILYYTSYKDGDTYKARVIGYDEVYKKDTCSLSDLTPRVMPNYQYLDTGSRNMDIFHKKRFRELDLNFNNRSGKSLTFALDFRLDGQPRQGTLSYSVEHNLDKTSVDYGVITYVRHNTDNIGIGGRTSLDVWELGTSGFPELDKTKVRFKISGKGFYAQYILISKNEEDFELLNHVWVCRPMFAR